MANGVAWVTTSITNAYAKVETGPATRVRANGRDIAVVGAVIECHQHGDSTICQSPFQTGSPTVRAGGKEILRLNDPAQCGHKIIAVSPDVSVA